ncbi:MAG TPA: fused MFS/spermidine synthase [Hyphomicrobiaceae bacterium]|nr:fused MFS/spermidine synthase [Hyphomicrobiaceae bacterium]
MSTSAPQSPSPRPRRDLRSFRLVGALAALAAAASLLLEARAFARSELVFESVYNYLVLEREGSIVRFRRMENGATVSAIDLADPRRQVIGYTGMLFGAALVKDNPRNVLSIGLGAGALNRLFGPTYPHARLTTVEIDPMILDVAKRHTGFRESAGDRVVLGDGRRHIARSTETWDWVVLDAFVRNSQVPFHLTTVEFYRLIAERLAPDGVLLTNLHYGGLLFESHLRTLREAFPQVVLFGGPATGNVVAAAVKYRAPDLLALVKGKDVAALPDLRRWGVDFAALKNQASDAAGIALSEEAPVLTDDFAPVEYLDLKPR